MTSNVAFHERFLWGAATSAHQIKVILGNLIHEAALDVYAARVGAREVTDIGPGLKYLGARLLY
jgi:hypothetical protein